MNGIMLAKKDGNQFNLAEFQKETQNVGLLGLLVIVKNARTPIGVRGTRQGREVAAFQIFYNGAIELGVDFGGKKVRVSGELDQETAEAIKRTKEKVGVASADEKGKKNAEIELDTKTLELLIKFIKKFLDKEKEGDEDGRTAIATIAMLMERLLVAQAIIQMNENSPKKGLENEQWKDLERRLGEMKIALNSDENIPKQLLDESEKLLTTAQGLAFLSGFEKIADDPHIYLRNLSRGKLENIRDAIQKAAENEKDRKGTIYLKFRTVVLIIEQILSETKA